MADFASDPHLKGDTPNQTDGGPDHGSTASAPRWVMVFGMVVVVLVLLFVVLHLTGVHSFGGHTPVPSGTQHHP
jgi:hypothetical protein